MDRRGAEMGEGLERVVPEVGRPSHAWIMQRRRLRSFAPLKQNDPSHSQELAYKTRQVFISYCKRDFQSVNSEYVLLFDISSIVVKADRGLRVDDCFNIQTRINPHKGGYCFLAE